MMFVFLLFQMAKTSLPSYIKDSIKDDEKRKLYRKWLSHELGVNRYVVWEDLAKIGLETGFKELIEFKVGKRHLRAWTSLFNLKEKVYQELVAEFMVTLKFDKSVSKLDDASMIKFNFQGKRYSMSLATFAVHLELYSEHQVTTKFFLDSECSPRQRDHTAIWSQYASGRFHSNVKARVFQDKYHNVLHNLLACSIRGKKKTKGAVGQKDLLIIKSIIETEHVNVAYLVADRLLTESAYSEVETVYMGAIITKLVRKMGLLTSDVISRLTEMKEKESQPYDMNYMIKVWLLEKDLNGDIRWKDGPLIPGVSMRPPRLKRARIDFDDSTVHREPRNEVHHEPETGETSVPDVEAQSIPTPQPRVFNWGDPPSSELFYGMLHMLLQRHTMDTYLAQEFGFPTPAPPTWVCGPLPPDFTTSPLHTFTMTPFTTTIPTITSPHPTTTILGTITRAHRSSCIPIPEPVFSVHTTTTREPHDPQVIRQPSSRTVTRPQPAESATSDTDTSSETDSPQLGQGFDTHMEPVQELEEDQMLEQIQEQIPTDYVPVLPTGPTSSGLTGLLDTTPVPSSDLPPVHLVQILRDYPLRSADIGDMGLDSNFHLYPLHPEQQQAASSGSVSRMASSGQHSVTQQAAGSSLPTLHESPADQDPPLP